MIQRAKIEQGYSTLTVLVIISLLAVITPAHADAMSSSTTSAVGDSPNKDDSTNDNNGVTSGRALPTDTTVATPAPAQPQQSTASKILYAISKHPDGREGKMPDWKIEQDKAVIAARAGHYDEALPTLARLQGEHPLDLSIASDNAAILGWAGRDAEAVAAYKALPAGTRPDYLIDSIGHSYRNLHQPEDALTVYRLGLQTYPDNQSFVAGEILSLLEAGHMEDAKAAAQAASDKYPTPSDDLVVAIKLTYRSDAVALGRAGQYKESLAEFVKLHDKYPDDVGITGDYVAVLSWAGHDVEATTLYRTMPQGDQPDYVLDAAAHSYRNLHQPQQALELYQAALEKSPDNVVYAVGVIYSLSDLGRSNEALEIAKAQLAKHPENPDILVKAYVYVERHRAIDLARAGHFDQALALLRQLRAKYPSDITEVMDYIAVSSWAGHDEDAVKEYQKIAKQPMPDYVLEAVGHSYRNLHEIDKALAVYRRGMKQSPRNEVFAAGEIRCLDDLGRFSEGQAHAQAFTHKYGDHLEVLLAGGEAANLNEQPIDALNFYEHAQAMSPKNHEAIRGLIHTEETMGAAHLALKTLNKHPGLMTGEEYRAIIGDTDQALVRWGPLEPASEATRYAETDRAIATLDAHISAWTAKNDPSVYPNIQRARFDRLIALRDRSRMQDVVDSYNSLVQEGVEIPAYALEAVGEAYLYLREPEIARDIFLKVLETEPNDFETRRLLAYAYLECDQYDEAYATIDKVVADEPVWIYLKGEPERQPNPNRALAESDAGSLRSYGDLEDQADERLTPIVQAGPYDSRNRDAAGNLYLSRGWPRKALEQFQLGKSIQDGRDVGNETGIASANLDLQNYQEAEAETKDLVQRFPENLGVQRADRLWQVHNMAELDAHAGYNFAPTGGGQEISPHGQGFDAGAELYSSPIDYNWRLFAGEDWSHEHEPNSEGIIDYSRTNAGVEYRGGNITATAAPTFNSYNSNDRVGADGTFKYTFNDVWTAGIAGELFSALTPLRALNAGVTANRFDVNGLWRQSESRELSLDAYVMQFSDNNTRTVQDGEFIQRLYTNSTFKLDSETDMTLSQDSENQNRLYYNPSHDLQFLSGLRATETLYHRYETLYEHSLLAMPGLYMQQHYGTSPAWTVRYEQRVYYNDTLNLGGGVNYTHQDYDGSAEDAVSLTMDVVERF
jgi:biofilm PGA synthesis protein PgaA